MNLVTSHQWVWSDRLKVNGVIDAVEEKQGELIPLEYKKGKQGRHLNDHFQLCAAALCIEERTNKTIDCGEIFYYGNRRRQKVEFTPQLRQMTESAIAFAHATTKGKMPPPINKSIPKNKRSKNQAERPEISTNHFLRFGKR